MLPTQFFKPVTRRVIAAWALLTRSMILGVRVVAFDCEGRILLVRHSYLPGWYLPGGGVDPGETCLAAAARELGEETGHASPRPLTLLGLFHNARFSRRNHVALYRADDCEPVRAVAIPNAEIVEIGWFAPSALPADATDATRRRLDEVLNARPPAETW
ncbi:MAG: NUDIX domain-containing protein [Hyphomicrobiaceae bacterium]|nr:NUDIX domain-containing protein [Hyphomicrobiaceae bacterium]